MSISVVCLHIKFEVKCEDFLLYWLRVGKLDHKCLPVFVQEYFFSLRYRGTCKVLSLVISHSECMVV